MPGVRIQHPTERNTMFTLVDANRPLAVRVECGACHRIHEFKTYHIKLDETGAAIVSKEIVERLRRIALNPFQFVNEVENPPTQIIHAPFIAVKVRPIGGITRGEN